MSQSSLNKDRDGNEAESADLDTSGFPYREDAQGSYRSCYGKRSGNSRSVCVIDTLAPESQKP